MPRPLRILLIALLILTVWTVATEIGSILHTSKRYMTIEVIGSVHHPGVYKLSSGSHILDAIEAAGGATEDAVLYEMNLAQPLKRGDKVYVP